MTLKVDKKYLSAMWEFQAFTNKSIAYKRERGILNSTSNYSKRKILFVDQSKYFLRTLLGPRNKQLIYLSRCTLMEPTRTVIDEGGKK